MWKAKMGIYRIVNTANNHIYIGSSNYLERRYKKHFNDLKKNIHTNPYLQNAFNKYGAASFVFQIIEIVRNENSLLLKEKFWIDFYKNKVKLYNLVDDPVTQKMSQETIEKIISKNKQRVNSYSTQLWTWDSKRNAAVPNYEYFKELGLL